MKKVYFYLATISIFCLIFFANPSFSQVREESFLKAEPIDGLTYIFGKSEPFFTSKGLGSLKEVR